jgi:chromatin segregation and condensation protein Rec8/ScpA/Scc1 (kleisin family)
MEQKGIVRERSDHLRNIIRKQLFCQGRDNLEKMESRKNVIISEAVEKPKEENRENRYKKLLSELYGDHTKYSNQITRKGKKENASNNPTPGISRHQSMKKLGELRPQP